MDEYLSNLSLKMGQKYMFTGSDVTVSEMCWMIGGDRISLTLVTWECIETWRFLRSITGRRKALTVLHRSPFRIVSWEVQ